MHPLKVSRECVYPGSTCVLAAMHLHAIQCHAQKYRIATAQPNQGHANPKECRGAERHQHNTFCRINSLRNIIIIIKLLQNTKFTYVVVRD